GPAAGAGDDQACGAVAHDLVEGLAPGSGFHDHARAAAVRGVVDGVVAVVGPGTQVVHLHLEQAGGAGLADQGQLEGREVVGEDTDDVDTHGVLVRSGGMGSAGPVTRPGRGRAVRTGDR